jgi:hypothetical protein
MRRFSIRTDMAFVLVSAIGLAALRNANEWWAGTMMLVAMAAVGIAVAGAVIMRGRERCWWATFAFFSASYLALAFAPGLSTGVGARLVTTTALDYLYRQYIAPSTQTHLPQVLWWQHAQALDRVDRLKAENREPGDRELDSAMRILINLETQLRGAADERDFLRVGHSFVALLAGLVRGTVAVWFYTRRESGGIDAGLPRRPEPITRRQNIEGGTRPASRTGSRG